MSVNKYHIDSVYSVLLHAKKKRMVTTNNVVILMVVVYFAWSVLCKSESINCRFASVGMSRTFTFLLCIVTYTPRKYYECSKNGELREVGVLLRTGGLSRHTCY